MPSSFRKCGGYSLRLNHSPIARKRWTENISSYEHLQLNLKANSTVKNKAKQWNLIWPGASRTTSPSKNNAWYASDHVIPRNTLSGRKAMLFELLSYYKFPIVHHVLFISGNPEKSHVFVDPSWRWAPFDAFLGLVSTYVWVRIWEQTWP